MSIGLPSVHPSGISRFSFSLQTIVPPDDFKACGFRQENRTARTNSSRVDEPAPLNCDLEASKVMI